MNHLLLWLAAAVAPTGILHPAPGTARAFVRVDIDEQGVIQSMQFREGTGERLQAILRERVQSWRFDPATANGRPAKAQTTITIDLKAGADGQSLEIAAVSAGVAMSYVVLPQYLPGPKNMQGSVVLRCRVAADGRCHDISVEQATAPERLQKSAMKSLANWRFETEIVSGVSVESWMLIPFCFSMHVQGEPVPECRAGESRAVAGTDPPRLKLRDPLAQR
jgi:TonB family protein